MPYIRNRDWIDARLRPLLDAFASDPHIQAGELNYIVTKILLAWLDMPSYDRFNAAIGALECAKLELYRRMVAPYEDKKIAENGDVYPNTKKETL